MTKPTTPALRHDWDLPEILELLGRNFNNLLFEAQGTHRQHFDPAAMQLSTLVNIKSGGCPEDCAYCPQSARYSAGVAIEKLMPVADVVRLAKAAKQKGASRFCMGAAWRSLADRHLARMEEMVREVSKLGLETCATLGMIDAKQACRLKDAGLDYYNHNLDTSPEFYAEVISTRDYQERLDTLQNVRAAGIRVCCGGILGMGESVKDRAGLLLQLANLPEHPESVPINRLVKVAGTPLADETARAEIDPLDFVRVIAAARIMMPASWIRLSAGRNEMDEPLQALCFLAGANSIFHGEKLLTTDNPEAERDQSLFARLGIKASV
ncbi:MAG: biotin synthase BioB [Candidatus Eutrophobiaceae bacterium]